MYLNALAPPFFFSFFFPSKQTNHPHPTLPPSLPLSLPPSPPGNGIRPGHPV